MLELFTLYVGCADATVAKDTVIAAVGTWFESYTLLDGEGYFRGMREPVLLVRIATADIEHVLAAAAEIRERLNQDGVGVEYGGVYCRCTATDCAAALRQRFVERRREFGNSLPPE